MLDVGIGGLLWPFIGAALLLCTARARFVTSVVEGHVCVEKGVRIRSERILTPFSLYPKNRDLLDLTHPHKIKGCQVAFTELLL